MIKYEVPATPTIGSSPHKFSLSIPKLNHGKPEITHDLSHSNKKKMPGIIKNLYLCSLK